MPSTTQSLTPGYRRSSNRRSDTSSVVSNDLRAAIVCPCATNGFYQCELHLHLPKDGKARVSSHPMTAPANSIAGRQSHIASSSVGGTDTVPIRHLLRDYELPQWSG